MYSLKINGFKTQAQAQAFLDWYGGAGEQDAATWFESSNIDATFMPVDYSVKQEWDGETLNATVQIFNGEEE